MNVIGGRWRLWKTNRITPTYLIVIWSIWHTQRRAWVSKFERFVWTWLQEKASRLFFWKRWKFWKHMIFCEYCNEYVRVGSADLTTICKGDLERLMKLISFSNEDFQQERLISSQWWLNGRTEKGESRQEPPAIIWHLTKTADELILTLAHHAYTLIESIDQ